MKIKKWEYYVAAISQTVSAPDMQAGLSSWGADGWELVQVTTRGLDLLFFFRRELDK